MLLLLSIFIPQYLGTLRLVVSDPPNYKNGKEICLTLVLLIFSPCFTYVQHFKNLYLELKLREFPSSSSLIEAKEKLKRILHHHVKLELGLETIYQLIITLILLFLSYTETPSQRGLEAVFNEDLNGWTLLALVSSIILSVMSCISSHLKGLTASREHFPAKSQIVASIFSLVGIMLRVMVVVMYFAVPLGLFNLHRHLQGEQIPYHIDVLDLVGDNGHGPISLGDNPPFEWDDVDRFVKNGSLLHFTEYGEIIVNTIGMNPEQNPYYLVSPPSYTLYVGLEWRTYLFIFFGHVGIHAISLFIAKYLLSIDFRKHFNWLDKIIHSLENTNIPYNAREWDDGKGDAEEHRNRMVENWFEVGVVIIINFVFNGVLLIPLCYLGKYKEKTCHFEDFQCDALSF